jgi:transposase
VINKIYADMATHYGTAILPARPYKPRDKAKVEVGVLIAERWLLGRLRHTKWTCFGKVESCFKSGGLPLVSGGADEIQ